MARGRKKGNGGHILAQYQHGDSDEVFEMAHIGTANDHAEKLLIIDFENSLVGKFGGAGAIKKIAIYTYSSPCDSCMTKLLKLRKSYPNAKLKLIFSDWYIPKGGENIAVLYIESGLKNLKRLVQNGFSVRFFSNTGEKYADQSAQNEIPEEVQWSGSKDKVQRREQAKKAIAAEDARVRRLDPFRLNKKRSQMAAPSSSASTSSPTAGNLQSAVQEIATIEQVEGTKDWPKYDALDYMTSDLMDAMEVQALLARPVKRPKLSNEGNDSVNSPPPNN